MDHHAASHWTLSAAESIFPVLTPWKDNPMTNRLITAAVSIALLPLFAAAASAATDAELDAKAQALNRKLLNIDAHTDVLIESTPERYWAPGHTSRTEVALL